MHQQLEESEMAAVVAAAAGCLSYCSAPLISSSTDLLASKIFFIKLNAFNCSPCGLGDIKLSEIASFKI